MKRMLVVGWVVLGALGCSGAPADVAGNYTVNLTNGANGCELDGWTEGQTSMSIPLVITQLDDSFTAEVTGATGLYLDLVVGSHTFTGTVSGSQITGELVGRAGSMGSCAYTTNVLLQGTLTGDVLEGTLDWYYDTNDSADCGTLATCANEQIFNGTRPPTR